MVWPWSSSLSFVDILSSLNSSYSSSFAMSDIYCHEDVLNFTNPFLNYEQGYQAPRKVATIPVSPKAILPEEPSTRWGYPRGESQGQSSGRVNLLSFLIGRADWFSIGCIDLKNATFVSSGAFYRKGNHHHPTDEECQAQDKCLFVYRYNQGGEKTRRDNKGRPYPSLMAIRRLFEMNKYRHNQFREMGLGDLVMAGKECWRRHVGTLDLEGFPKAWIQRGLREIHHANDNMDGRMDACLGYTAVLRAKIFESMGELQEELREDQKKRSLDGWERMDTKRQLEDSLRDAQGEIADLKAQVNTLEFLVEKLTCPTSEVPREAVFRPASPPLPDIGFPPSMEIPGLTVNQAIVDDFLDWSSFDRSWPHGGYEADVEKDGDGSSNKENEWVAVLVDE